MVQFPRAAFTTSYSLFSSRLRAQPADSSLPSGNQKNGGQETRTATAPATLGDLWAHAVARHSDRVYVAAADGSWQLTYAQADRMVRHLEAGLGEFGVGPGARLIADATPSGSTALLFWAAMLRGSVFVPLDSTSQPDAVRVMVARCTPVLGITGGIFGDVLRAAGVTTVTADEVARTGSQRAPDVGPVPRPDETAVILFTSGTTGTPKGVALSHAALARSGRLVCDVWGLKATDRLLSIGPYHTMSALRNPLIATACSGAAGIVPVAPEARSAIGIVETCRTRPVTVLSTVPALLKVIGRMDAGLTRPALKSLRLVLSTAAALTPDTRRQFARHCDAPVLDYYGLTETCGACIFQDSANPPAGSIGRPRGVAIRIEHPDGKPAGAGEPGELLIGSENLMQGYWGQPEETAKVLRNGWLRTGDIVRQDDSGMIWLVGRSRDIIKRPDGELVDLCALEALAEATGLITDAAACAQTDAHGDEAIILYVSPLNAASDFKALRQHLWTILGRTVRDIVVTDALPRGANGKVLKHALMQSYSGRSAT